VLKLSSNCDFVKILPGNVVSFGLTLYWFICSFIIFFSLINCCGQSSPSLIMSSLDFSLN